MENGIEPKRTISLTWDDPWKKYEERWKKKPRGEGRPLLYSDISRTERTRRKLFDTVSGNDYAGVKYKRK